MNKQVPVNKWTITVVVLASLLLIGIGSATAGTPETKTKTVTEYKTKTVKDDSQTYEIAELKVQLETCQASTLLASQAFVDMTNAFVALAEGASTFDIDKVDQATGMIDGIDSGAVGSKARECDSSIASKITGLPGQ